MANFPIGDSQKSAYVINETDGRGNPVAADPADTVVVTSSDTDSATIVPDATPVAGVGSGFVVGGAKLQTGVVLTATVSHADGSSLTATDVIDIVPGAATALSFGLGAPIPQ